MFSEKRFQKSVFRKVFSEKCFQKSVFGKDIGCGRTARRAGGNRCMPVEPYVRPGAIKVYFFYILCYHIENLRRLSGSRDAF